MGNTSGDKEKRLHFSCVRLCRGTTTFIGDGGYSYQLASNSKAFTALGVLWLADHGYLDLDTPLSLILPDLKFHDRGGHTHFVTARQLLCHTGGLDGATIRFQKEGDRNLPDTAIKITRTALRTTPGEAFCYATGGYVILGYLIEVLSGLPYGKFIAQKILQPLGLRHTHAETVPLQGLKRGLFGLRRSRWKGCPAFAPAGYLVSTPGDMARWLSIQLGQTPAEEGLDHLLKQSRDTTTYVQTPKEGRLYGYGWYFDEEGDIYLHDGDNPHFSSCLAFSLQKETAVVVLADVRTGACETLCLQECKMPTGSKTLQRKFISLYRWEEMLPRTVLLFQTALCIGLTTTTPLLPALVLAIVLEWLLLFMIHRISGGLSLWQAALWLKESELALLAEIPPCVALILVCFAARIL